ncbi:pseudouridine synthase [Polychytrium aggregatum]|uniref:pseudouridine synthase n=1 Tax=Polychytrium aggregatum TaxID=110093 RepID=UPI0022FECFF0|nr:pseudouridine synthase [Polychytrium aggregatum]KAI9209456.1 pseudouridine synthase [Polychytrium aggregatum]
MSSTEHSETRKRPGEQSASDEPDLNRGDPKKEKKGRPPKADDDIDEPAKYTIENGLRKVEPYHFKYKSYAKGRWFGRTIMDVFVKEFQDETPEYYTRAISSGKIQVNGKTVSLDYPIKNGDVIIHFVHRHEPPVTADKIDIVHQDDEMLVVSKPSSLPIHPTGRYNHNSMIRILQSSEYGFGNLYTANRLDRLTSGLALIALTKEKSKLLMTEMMERNIRKTYLSRVKGEFPMGDLICNEPILTVSYKLGLNIVSPDGKPCTTYFRRLSYNGLTSVVECKPVTGRTHQIRVHLQYLGFPIANDPLYCSEAWGKDIGKGGIAEEAKQAIIARMEQEVFPSTPCPTDSAPSCSSSNAPCESTAGGSSAVAEPSQVMGDFRDYCSNCIHKRSDPIPQQLQIYLHSWRYESDGWNFQTQLPEWALESYTGDKELVDRFWKYGGKWDGRSPGEWLGD